VTGVTPDGSDALKEGVRVLVVYFSRSETTHEVASVIARELGADLERITDGTDRSGFRGYMRSGKEASTKALPEISPPKKDPADYELVVIGTPVWAWTMCSPIRTYLTSYKSRISRGAFFCTADGRESNTLGNMAELVGKPAEAAMVVYRKEVKKGSFKAKTAKFVSDCKNRIAMLTGGNRNGN
jgi:flavodoxin